MNKGLETLIKQYQMIDTLRHFNGVVDSDIESLIECLKTMGVEIRGTVLEFGSGIGLPSFLFHYLGASKVYGIEKDNDTMSLAIQNREALGIQNDSVEFINRGDSRVCELFEAANIIYCYPLDGDMSYDLLQLLSAITDPSKTILINTYTNNFGAFIDGYDDDNLTFSTDPKQIVNKRIKGYSNLVVKGYISIKKEEGSQTNLLILSIVNYR